ncbi:MAG: HupF/HypC family [Thermoleophilaceae bacterium]|jgi:hydrogenase maturation factor|nr:HupF/HypC family [Thermoleophilaceae bacterium]
MTSGAPFPPMHCDHDAHCITCGDEAVPLRVVKIDEQRELALCENDAGERTTVEIALVAPVTVDALLLVHAGTAIATAP